MLKDFPNIHEKPLAAATLTLFLASEFGLSYLASVTTYAYHYYYFAAL